MSGMVDAITGKGAKKQAAALAAAQATQQKELDAEKARLDAIEGGQNKVRQGGGGRGLLAYIDDTLKQKFGK